jgi:hypothetical protein
MFLALQVGCFSLDVFGFLDVWKFGCFCPFDNVNTYISFSPLRSMYILFKLSYSWKHVHVFYTFLFMETRSLDVSISLNHGSS